MCMVGGWVSFKRVAVSLGGAIPVSGCHDGKMRLTPPGGYMFFVFRRWLPVARHDAPPRAQGFITGTFTRRSSACGGVRPALPESQPESLQQIATRNMRDGAFLRQTCKTIANTV
jgi:hypothetical protein